MARFQSVRRLAGALRTAPPAADAPSPPSPPPIDSGLEQFYGEQLREIDAACARHSAEEAYGLFRELDDDVWALLLAREYELYPNIRAVLPDMPEPALQELWNGTSGLALARQSRSFYTQLRAAYARHGDRPIGQATVLDFGCGWGRLTRYLLRDVAPGRLYACDPVEGILDICRSNRVGAHLARSEFRPERVPFDTRFDLALAFSVFTHLSEPAHEACLRALHRALNPGGVLVVTVRPPGYLSSCAAMHPVRDEIGPDPEEALAGSRYLFVPHPSDPRHPQQHSDGQLDYGETVITMAYVRERWSRWFELLESRVQLDDPEQVILVLRRA